MSQKQPPTHPNPKVQSFLTRWVLMRAAFLSMLIFGIWHGAGWTYVLYGGFHGSLLAIYHFVAHRDRPVADRSRGAAGAPGAGAKISGDASLAARKRLEGFLGWAWTFAMVTVAWMIFRASSMDQALALMARAFQPWSYPGRTVPDIFVFRTLMGMALVLAVGYVARSRAPGKPLFPLPAWEGAGAKFGVLAAEGLSLGVLLVIALICMTGDGPTFVYFQF